MYALIGVTGYDLPTLAALTIPQLHWLMRGQGQILYPRLRPQLDANWAHMDKDGVAKILRGRAAEPPPPTREERDRAEAYRIAHAFYLPSTPAAGTALVPKAEPIAGLPVGTARAVMAFAEAGGFPENVWADDVAPLWHQIQATAAQGTP